MTFSIRRLVIAVGALLLVTAPLVSFAQKPAPEGPDPGAQQQQLASEMREKLAAIGKECSAQQAAIRQEYEAKFKALGSEPGPDHPLSKELSQKTAANRKECVAKQQAVRQEYHSKIRANRPSEGAAPSGTGSQKPGTR